MNRHTQYALSLGLVSVAVALSYLGFVYTGGAVPWGDRFAAVMDGGVNGATGSLFQFGRGGIGGFVLAGPLRDNVIPFVLLVLVLVGASAFLYWWAGGTEENGH
ncbi:hypothetical protein [Halodesulfurarchaeum sp.]|uniref:hypothetical protein n=1 Tax=Halodesulfurarchaeum sp. TaxID=1980530 RepID=UPI002FC2F79E